MNRAQRRAARPALTAAWDQVDAAGFQFLTALDHLASLPGGKQLAVEAGTAMAVVVTEAMGGQITYSDAD